MKIEKDAYKEFSLVSRAVEGRVVKFFAEMAGDGRPRDEQENVRVRLNKASLEHFRFERIPVRVRHGDAEFAEAVEGAREGVLSAVQPVIDEVGGGKTVDGLDLSVPMQSADLRRFRARGRSRYMSVREGDRYRLICEGGKSLAEYLKTDGVTVVGSISSASIVEVFNELGGYGFDVNPALFEALHDPKFKVGLPKAVVKLMTGRLGENVEGIDDIPILEGVRGNFRIPVLNRTLQGISSRHKHVAELLQTKLVPDGGTPAFIRLVSGEEGEEKMPFSAYMFVKGVSHGHWGFDKFWSMTGDLVVGGGKTEPVKVPLGFNRKNPYKLLKRLGLVDGSLERCILEAVEGDEPLDLEVTFFNSGTV